MNNITNSDKLLMIRNIESLNQKEFAERLGVKQSYYSGLERGNREITAKIINSLIREFNISPNWFIADFGEMYITNDDISISQSDNKNINYVNVSKKKQTEIMHTDSVPVMHTRDKMNVNTGNEDSPGIITDKSHDNSNIVMNKRQNDIIESNKEFFEEYLHGAYGELKEDHWEYLQIRYYEPMSIYRLKTLYSVEIERLKEIYNSRKNLVEILHYLQPAELLLEKFPIEPDFKEYFKDVNEEWNEDFEVLKDKKLELILKIIHTKQGTEHQSGQLAKLINYMSMYKELLISAKPLK